MRFALLGDVHANIHALDAVLDALAELDAQRALTTPASPHAFDLIVCVGDIVGYNAHPSECIARLREADVTAIMGNHDHDAVAGTSLRGTSRSAMRALAWTRRALSTADVAYLASLPRVRVWGDAWVAVHGSFQNEATRLTGYVTETSLPMNLRTLASNANWPRLGVCGHTHIPMIGWLAGENDAPDVVNADFHGAVTWPAEARAVIINAGSVGQPRDGDPRAAFAIVDVEARCAELFRVHYDIDAAARAIAATDLPSELALRLLEAR